MPRARNIKPTFFTNEDLCDLPPLARLLFAGLWCIADRDGRLKYQPRTIKIHTLPHDEANIEELLEVLAKREFILIYEAEGQKYVQVLAFNKHQNPHHKEPLSTIPEPEPRFSPSLAPVLPRSSPSLVSEIPERARLIPDSGSLIPDTGYLNPAAAAPPPEVLPQPTPEPSKVTQMRPVTLLERDTGWDQIREVWDDGATVIPGEGDWSQALVHWRRLSFEEKKLAVDDRVEMARMLKAGEFHVSSGGLPQSYFQHKHFGRRVKASAAQKRSRPKSKQDQIADAFAAVERNIHAGYRTEP